MVASRHVLILLLTSSILAVGSCDDRAATIPEITTGNNLAKSAKSPRAPSRAELETELRKELARLGIDPLHAAAKAPTEISAVFDLCAELVDDEPEDTIPPTGVRLGWSYRCVGDCNMDGEVGVSDLTPLSLYWLESVTYDDPALRGGVTCWPSGLPTDDGGMPDDEPPALGSGAANWRAALTDGNSDGQINISDITPIGQNFGVRVGGYLIYRRPAGEEEFTQIATLEHPTSWDSRRPLIYSYLDEFTVEDDYEYIVRPYGTALAELGPLSNLALSLPATEEEYPWVELAAEPVMGMVPLQVSFSATAAAAPPYTIVNYEWDFIGDGEYDLTAESEPVAEYTYEEPDQYLARVRVTDSAGSTALAGVLITAGDYPTAELVAQPPGGEVPVTVVLDASASHTPVGEIKQFEWDLDDDGNFELNSGLISWQAVEYASAGEVSVSVRVTSTIELADTEYLNLQLTDDYDEIEPNGSYSSATVMGHLPLGLEQAWRGNIGTGGYDGDEEDWLSFAVDNGCFAELTLATSGPGVRLDLCLIDTDGFSVLTQLPNVDENAQLLRGLRGAGTYFVKVANANTTTGLNYDYLVTIATSELVYDEIENNDTPLEANDLGFVVASLMPGVWGNLGPAGLDGDDEDWYRFSLTQAAEVIVQLGFFHHEADLELALLNDTGTVLLAVSEGVTNKEEVALELAAGDYLVRCYRSSGGTANYQLAILVIP